MAVAVIGFHVTDRCQLDCQHCLRDPAEKPKDLPLAIIQKVLAEAKAVYGVAQVALTGGEPLLHPDLEGILDAIVVNDLSWHLVTNGKRLPRLLELLGRAPARRVLLSAVNFS